MNSRLDRAFTKGVRSCNRYGEGKERHTQAAAGHSSQFVFCNCNELELKLRKNELNRMKKRVRYQTSSL